MIQMNSTGVDVQSWKFLFTLYTLAEVGAHLRTVKVSTQYLAGKMNVSQQTASRHLIELERKGWIERTVTQEGSLTKVVKAGMDKLKSLHSSLSLIVEAKYPPSLTLEGILFTGLGEGAYYIMQDGYRKQFIEKLRFDPYPGTLNLKLTNNYDRKVRSELEAYPSIEIEGFKAESRTFGPVKCYPVIINNKEKGAVLLATRSHYNSSVIEVIAPTFLRNKLKLKDGNKVKIEVLILP
jgi:riboflavin kinase